MAPGDTIAQQRDSLMNAVLATIRGRERAPAESVFEDIQVFKGIPAGEHPAPHEPRLRSLTRRDMQPLPRGG